MKLTFRIPTQDQYAFVEVEQEVEEMSQQELRTRYDELVALFKNSEGLSQKEFNEFLDTYLTTGKPGNVESWEQMSKEQKVIINHIKLHLKRKK